MVGPGHIGQLIIILVRDVESGLRTTQKWDNQTKVEFKYFWDKEKETLLLVQLLEIARCNSNECRRCCDPGV